VISLERQTFPQIVATGGGSIVLPAGSIPPPLNKAAAPYAMVGPLCFVLRGGVIALRIFGPVDGQPTFDEPFSRIDAGHGATATARSYWSRSDFNALDGTARDEGIQIIRCLLPAAGISLIGG
jgi:hypothetical protein